MMTLNAVQLSSSFPGQGAASLYPCRLGLGNHFARIASLGMLAMHMAGQASSNGMAYTSSIAL